MIKARCRPPVATAEATPFADERIGEMVLSRRVRSFTGSGSPDTP